jgi:phage-related protein
MDGWRVEVLNGIVQAEIEALPEYPGPSCTYRRDDGGGWAGVDAAPHVKPLRDKLWEMRMSGKDGIARAIYMAARGRRIVILHAFVKKTQKTPPQAIRLALTRAKELEP